MGKKKSSASNAKLPYVILAIALGALLLLVASFYPSPRNSTRVDLKSQLLTPTPIPIIEPKLSSADWISYTGPNLGVTIKYPPNWTMYDASLVQAPGRQNVIFFDSPDVVSPNTKNGGGIEMVIYTVTNLQEMFYTDLSAYEYVKKKLFVNPEYTEFKLKNGLHVIKFEHKDKIDTIVIPYREDAYFVADLKYQDPQRQQEAVSIADAMIDSLMLEKL